MLAENTIPLRDRTGALRHIPQPIQQLLGPLLKKVWAPAAPGLDLRVRVLDVGWDRLRHTNARGPLPCALVQVSAQQGSDDYPQLVLNYALIGKTAEGRAYSLPVSGTVRRGDGPLGSMCARAQGWLLGANLRAPHLNAALDQIWRQGDVALSPYPMAQVCAPFPVLFTLNESKLEAPAQLSGDHWLESARMVFYDRRDVAIVTDPLVRDRSGRRPPLALQGTFRVHHIQTAPWRTLRRAAA